MKLRLSIPVATTVFGSLLLLALPGQGRCETLHEAVAAALSVNPDVMGAKARVGVARSQLDQARAGAQPTLDFRAVRGAEETDSVITRSQGHRSPVTLGRNEESLTMRLMLYDGKKVSSDVRHGVFAVDSQVARRSDARETVALDVVNAYLDVLRAQELLVNTENLVSAHTDTAEKTAWRFKRGVGTRADAQLAEGRLASASATLVSQQARLASARVAYQRAVEHPPDKLKPVTPPDKLPASEQQALDEALAQHPSCVAVDADIAAAQAALDGARGRFSPQLDLVLDTSRTHNVNGMKGSNSVQSAMLQLNYNLSRGGGDEARVRELVEQLGIAAEIRHKTHVSITEAVSRAWIEIGAARSRLVLLEKHLASTEQVLDAYRAQYEVDKRTLLDTLNAESEMYQAKIDLANGRYDLLAAQYRLLGEMGVLVKSFGLAEEDVLEHTANN